MTITLIRIQNKRKKESESILHIKNDLEIRCTINANSISIVTHNIHAYDVDITYFVPNEPKPKISFHACPCQNIPFCFTVYICSRCKHTITSGKLPTILKQI